MPPDFTKQIVDLVAKRAAYVCSNPDCHCSTVGSNSDPSKSTTIGQAAHIFGARPGLHRFRNDMTDDERSASTNAIWLCPSCHNKVDRDEILYPAELLFMWKIRKENATTRLTANAGDLLRSELQAEEMRDFIDIPIYARQLISTKSDKWEFYLTAELMLHYLKPIIQRKTELDENLYTLKTVELQGAEYLSWIQVKLFELNGSNNALCNVLAQFNKCWGQLGQRGNPHLIKRTCELFSQCAMRLMTLAEEAKFTRHPNVFLEINKLFIDGVLHILNGFAEFPKKFKNLINEMSDAGQYRITMVIELPNNWEDEMRLAIQKAEAKILSGVEFDEYAERPRNY
jgi:hypothetical protein